MANLKDMMKSSGKAYPGTSVKFRQNKGKVSISSAKPGKLPMGTKANLK